MGAIHEQQGRFQPTSLTNLPSWVPSLSCHLPTPKEIFQDRCSLVTTQLKRQLSREVRKTNGHGSSIKETSSKVGSNRIKEERKKEKTLYFIKNEAHAEKSINSQRGRENMKPWQESPLQVYLNTRIHQEF